MEKNFQISIKKMKKKKIKNRKELIDIQKKDEVDDIQKEKK